MNKIKIALASFLLVNSFAFAENMTDFQVKAVKDLYNKGILQSIVKEEDFSKKESFSRGEIATIIYNTLALKNGESLKDASTEDIVVLKSLISDFSSELVKLGARDYELLDIVNNGNNTINSRIDKEVLTLNEKIDRIKVTGDFAIVKEFDRTENKAELMSDVKGEGEIALALNLNENVSAKMGYDLENEKGIYALNIKNNGLSVMAFNDETISVEDWTTTKEKDRRYRKEVIDKKLPNFDNGFGIIDKAGINNNDTIVLNKKMETKDVLALVTSTEEDDIYGFQYKSKMKFFMATPGSDSNLNISYVGIDKKANLADDRTFLILGTDFLFPINENAKQSIVYNYSKMDKTELDTPPSGIHYLFPIVAEEASYLYGKTEINGKNKSKTEIVLAAVNTGYNYDTTGLTDSDKYVFAESDVIKLDKNILGGIALVKYDYKSFLTDFSSITYKTNNNTTEDSTNKIETLYSLKDGKTKVGLGIGINKEDELERNFVEGKVYLTESLGKDTKDYIKLNIANETTTDKNEVTARIEHTKVIKDVTLLLASEYKDVVAENTVKVALNYEKIGKISEKYNSTTFIGGLYERDIEADSEGYKIFTENKVDIRENLHLDAGLRYSHGCAENNGTIYAASLTYDFTKDFKISGIYGPIDVLDENSNDIFKNKTDGIYGDAEQNIGSIKIIGKF